MNQNEPMDKAAKEPDEVRKAKEKAMRLLLTVCTVPAFLKRHPKQRCSTYLGLVIWMTGAMQKITFLFIKEEEAARRFRLN